MKKITLKIKTRVFFINLCYIFHLVIYPFNNRSPILLAIIQLRFSNLAKKKFFLIDFVGFIYEKNSFSSWYYLRKKKQHEFNF